jgi:RecA-family ATPase
MSGKQPDLLDSACGEDGDCISVLPTFRESLNGLPVSWIQPGMLREGTAAMFVGHPGSGKSTFCLKWGDAIANGKEFLGHKHEARPFAYLDRDVNSVDDLIERMKWLQIQDGGNFRYFGSNFPQVDVPMPGSKMVEKWVDKQSVKPVILCDSFVNFLEGGDENSAKDVAKLWDNIRKLRRFGVSFIFLHHLGKGVNAADFIRGSTAIRAGLDFAFKVENTTPGANNRDKNLTQMRITRVKHRNNSKFGNQDSQMTIQIGESGLFQPQITFKKPLQIRHLGRPKAVVDDDAAEDEGGGFE